MGGGGDNGTTIKGEKGKKKNPGLFGFPRGKEGADQCGKREGEGMGGIIPDRREKWEV